MSNTAKKISDHTSKKLSSLQGEINNSKDLQTAIDLADSIFIQPRYSLSEKWLRISVAEARFLLEGATEILATLENNELFLG